MASGAGGGRQSWSAPQNGDPFGFNGPNSIMPGTKVELVQDFITAYYFLTHTFIAVVYYTTKNFFFLLLILT